MKVVLYDYKEGKVIDQKELINPASDIIEFLYDNVVFTEGVGLAVVEDIDIVEGYVVLRGV